MNETQILIIKTLIETIVVTGLFCWIFAGWITHLIMMKMVKKDKGWGTFKKFKKHYYAYGENKWVVDPLYKNSLFSGAESLGERQEFQLHATEFIFDGNGMKITDPINFKLIQHFIKKECKKKRDRQGMVKSKKVKF